MNDYWNNSLLSHRLLADIKNLIQQTNSSFTQLKDIGVSSEADQVIFNLNQT